MLIVSSRSWLIIISLIVFVTLITLFVIWINISFHGDRLVFLTSFNGVSDIYTARPDGSGLMNLTNDPAYYQRPIWSPDGRKIAFMKNKDNNMQIYIVNSDGTGIEPVNGANSLDIPAGWSPDGKYLLVLSHCDIQAEVYVISVSDGTRYRLTNEDADKGDPSWSPDGRSIAYEAFDADLKVWQIYIKQLDSGVISKLTDYEYGAVFPVWSTDGTRMAFCKMNGARTADIYILDLDTKEIQQITDNVGMNIPFSWSPDNKQILAGRIVSSSGGVQTDVSFYNIGSSSDPVKLEHEFSATGFSYDWSKTTSKKIKAAVPPLKQTQAIVDTNGGKTIALINGTLIDGTGSTPLSDAVIVVKDGIIESVGKSSEIKVSDDAQIIDLSGSFILPGFFDAHVHGSYDSSKLKQWLREGVTTVCDLGGNMNQMKLYDFKNHVIVYPEYTRIISAGPVITAPDGHWVPSITLSVSSVSDAADKTEWLINQGADIIKVYFQSADPLGGTGHPILSSDEIKSIVDAAHMNGKKVIVHADLLNRENFWNISGTGIDALAHLPLFNLSDEDISRLINDNIYIITTLEVLDPKYIASKNLGNFIKAGGKVVLGSDYGGSPYGIEMELGMPMKEINYMKDAGMSSMQIIVSGTKNAAYICGRESDLGSLEKGKIADILIVNGNPIEDINNLKNVKMVIKDGVIIEN